MIWRQAALRLRERPRGCHLVTDEVLAGIDLGGIATGMLQVFLQHTSAALTLNENADPDVRRDAEGWLTRTCPDAAPYFRHRDEGDDDMSAHLVASLLGPSLLLPVRNGRPALGTWQGIWLVEWRHHGGARSLLLTAWGVGAIES